MPLLREIGAVRQVAGEPRRRWFTSRTMDLFVWVDEAGAPAGFQLTYDKGSRERAFTWKPELGYLHTAVDDGERSGEARHKATPLLVGDGRPDVARLQELLAGDGAGLPAEVSEFVATMIKEYVHA